MKNAKVVEHPLIQHGLTKLRDKKTRPADFRKIMTEMSSMLAYEATRDIKASDAPVDTPLEKTQGPLVSEKLLLISILRAGNGMLDGFLRMLPFARVGHIGIYRDKNLKTTVEYYFRIPNNAQGDKVILVDPMLATGDTAIAAINRLKEYDVGPIRLVGILASPEGVQKLHEAHPDVMIYTASVDRQLNEKGYILPGLGDAGDRLYDTL